MLPLGDVNPMLSAAATGALSTAVYAQKPNEYRRTRWEVTLKMDDGTTRVVSMAYEPLFVQIGDYVRVAGNNIELVNP